MYNIGLDKDARKKAAHLSARALGITNRKMFAAINSKTMTRDSNSAKAYPVFLSSLCRELITLRERIFFEAGKSSQIYVDERIKRRDIKHQDDLECADELIKRVREANTFICVLGGCRHGSSIKIDKQPSNVSFFEIELFQAALMQKEIHLFVRDDFDPEPRLKNLLGILKFAFPEWTNISVKTDNQIVDEVKRLLDKDRSRKSIRTLLALRAPINRLIQALFAARARGKMKFPIFFLGGLFELSGKNADEKIINHIISKVTGEPNEEKRLSRLWIGIRELMSVPYTDLKNQIFLNYWNKLLGEWAKAGAWYGLNGDTPLGCLAALNSMTKVREQLSKEYGAPLPSEDVAYPGGALASAKYSIAKRLYIRQDRHARLNEALQDIDRSLQNRKTDESGLLAIRGSILRQLGKISEAIADYESVLKTRQRQKYPEGSIGEALSELGFAYLRQGRVFKGLSFSKEGVELLRQSTRPGFLVRGLRKLSYAYLSNGRFVRAFETWQEAKSLAYKHGTFDQI